jgi:pimeloyl-ACP methyl ester carboxylesterase
MRLVHLAIENRTGRMFAKAILKTRISNGRWDPVPLPPDDAAALIAPIPLLIVHGDKDDFFPLDHPQQIYDAAGDPKELWIVPGFGHAESGAGPQLVKRIGTWVRGAVGLGAERAHGDTVPGGTGDPAAPGADPVAVDRTGF